MDSYNKITTDEALLREFQDTNTRDADSMFAPYNDISITEAGPEGARGELIVSRHSLNPHGLVHGGALAALADTVGGAATYAAYRQGCVTVNYSLSFLHPAKGITKKISCLATPLQLGNRLCVYRVSLTDDQGCEVATGNFTFYLTGWRSPPTN